MGKNEYKPAREDLSSEIDKQQIRLDEFDGTTPDGKILLNEKGEKIYDAEQKEKTEDLAPLYIGKVNEVQSYISQLRTQVEVEKNIASTKLEIGKIGPDWMALQDIYENVEVDLHTMLLSVQAKDAVTEREKYTAEIDGFITRLQGATEERSETKQQKSYVETSEQSPVPPEEKERTAEEEENIQARLMSRLPNGLPEVFAKKLGISIDELAVHPELPQMIRREKQRIQDQMVGLIEKKNDQKKMMQAQIDDLIEYTGKSEYDWFDVFTSKIENEDTIVQASIEQIKKSRARIIATEQEIGQIMPIGTKLDIALAVFDADNARAEGRTEEADRRLLQVYDEQGDGLLEQKYSERIFLKKNPPSTRPNVQYARHTPADVLRKRIQRQDIPEYLHYRTAQVEGKEQVTGWSMDGNYWMPLGRVLVEGGAFNGKRPSEAQEEFLEKLKKSGGDIQLLQDGNSSQISAKMEFGEEKDPELANEIKAAAQRLRTNKQLTKFEENHYFKEDSTKGDDLKIAIDNKNVVDSAADIVDQIQTRNTFKIASSVSVQNKYIGTGRTKSLGLYYQGRKQTHLHDHIECTLQYSNGESVTVLLHPNTKKILDSLPKEKQPILLRKFKSISTHSTTGRNGIREMKVAPYECVVRDFDIGYIDAQGDVYQQNGPKLDLKTHENGEYIENQLHTRRSFTVSKFTPPDTLQNMDGTPYGKLLLNIQTQSGKEVQGVKIATDAKKMMDEIPPEGMTLVLKRIPRSIELSEKISRGRTQSRAKETYYRHVLVADTITANDLEYAKIENGELIQRSKSDSENSKPTSVKGIEEERELKSRDVVRAMKHDRDINFTKRAASSMENTVQNLQGILTAKDAGSAREPFIQFAQEEARPMLAMLQDGQTMEQLQSAKQKLLDLKKSSSGVALTGIEAEINEQILALDGFITMIQSGRTQHLLETILDASKFTADTWADWFSNELPTIVAAVIVATAAVVSITVTFGGATPFWVAAAGAAGGLLAQEAIAEAQYYRRQGSAAVQAGLALNTERSLLGKKLTGQKKFNEATGKYEELEWMNDVVNPYAQQFAVSFASTYAIVVGGTFAGGVLGKILSNPTVLSKFATRLPTLTRALIRISSKSAETLGKAKNLKEIFERAANTLPKEVLEEFGDEMQEGILEKFLNHIEKGIVVADSLDGQIGWGTYAAGVLTMLKSIKLGQSKVPYTVQGRVNKQSIQTASAEYKAGLEAQKMIVEDLGNGYLQITDPETGNVSHAVPPESDAENEQLQIRENALALIRNNPTDLVALKNYLKTNDIDPTTRSMLTLELLLSNADTAEIANKPGALVLIANAVEASHKLPGGIDTGTPQQNAAKLRVIAEALIAQGIDKSIVLQIAKRFTDAGLAGKPSDTDSAEINADLQTVRVYSIGVSGIVQINLQTLQVGRDLVMVQNQNGTEVTLNRGKIASVTKDNKKITVTDANGFEYKFFTPVQNPATNTQESTPQKPAENTRTSKEIPTTETSNWSNNEKSKSKPTVNNDQFKDRFIKALTCNNFKSCADSISKDINDSDSAVEWIIASADMNNPIFLNAANKADGSDAAAFQRSVVDSFRSKPETMRAEIIGKLVERGHTKLAEQLASTFQNELAVHLVAYGTNNKTPNAVGRALSGIADTSFDQNTKARIEAKMKAEQNLITLATKAHDEVANTVKEKGVTYEKIEGLKSVIALKIGIIEYQKKHGNGDLPADLRTSLASILLNSDLETAQQEALQAAHEKDGEIDKVDAQQAFGKGRALMNNKEFNRLQSKLLLDAGLAGTATAEMPSTQSLAETRAKNNLVFFKSNVAKISRNLSTVVNNPKARSREIKDAAIAAERSLADVKRNLHGTPESDVGQFKLEDEIVNAFKTAEVKLNNEKKDACIKKADEIIQKIDKAITDGSTWLKRSTIEDSERQLEQVIKLYGENQDKDAVMRVRAKIADLKNNIEECKKIYEEEKRQETLRKAKKKWNTEIDYVESVIDSIETKKSPKTRLLDIEYAEKLLNRTVEETTEEARDMGKVHVLQETIQRIRNIAIEDTAANARTAFTESCNKINARLDALPNNTAPSYIISEAQYAQRQLDQGIERASEHVDTTLQAVTQAKIDSLLLNGNQNALNTKIESLREDTQRMINSRSTTDQKIAVINDAKVRTQAIIDSAPIGVSCAKAERLLSSLDTLLTKAQVKLATETQNKQQELHKEKIDVFTRRIDSINTVLDKGIASGDKNSLKRAMTKARIDLGILLQSTDATLVDTALVESTKLRIDTMHKVQAEAQLTNLDTAIDKALAMPNIYNRKLACMELQVELSTIIRNVGSDINPTQRDAIQAKIESGLAQILVDQKSEELAARNERFKQKIVTRKSEVETKLRSLKDPEQKLNMLNNELDILERDITYKEQHESDLDTGPAMTLFIGIENAIARLKQKTEVNTDVASDNSKETHSENESANSTPETTAESEESYFHGSTSAALIGILGKDNPGMTPAGTLLSRGDVPFTGELGPGIQTGNGVNIEHTSYVNSFNFSDAYNYAIALSKTKWTPKYSMELIQEMQHKYESSLYNFEKRLCKQTIEIEEKRQQRWNSLSETEQELVQNPFPIFIVNRKKPSETTKVRTDIQGETLIGTSSLEEITIYVPVEKIEFMRQFAAENGHENVDIQPIENVARINNVAENSRYAVGRLLNRSDY